MAHHSPNFDDEILRQIRSEIGKLGPTGKFPQGRLTSSDEGEIRLAIGTQGGKVIIDFGSQVTWIGFTADQAEEIAAMLSKHAASLRS